MPREANSPPVQDFSTRPRLVVAFADAAIQCDGHGPAPALPRPSNHHGLAPALAVVVALLAFGAYAGFHLIGFLVGLLTS